MKNEPGDSSTESSKEEAQIPPEIVAAAIARRDRAMAAHATLRDELSKESDRGAILVGTSILELRIQDLISTILVPNAEKDDALFSGANAPLSAFSSKIDIAFRLGLISERLRNDLHILRKIRNDCAHRPAGCSFDDDSIKDRTNSIASDHVGIRTLGNYAGGVSFEKANTRDRYIETLSWINYFLLSECEKVQVQNRGAKARRPEFAYHDQSKVRSTKLHDLLTWID